MQQKDDPRTQWRKQRQAEALRASLQKRRQQQQGKKAAATPGSPINETPVAAPQPEK
jgi:hypothetical protein